MQNQHNATWNSVSQMAITKAHLHIGCQLSGWKSAWRHTSVGGLFVIARPRKYTDMTPRRSANGGLGAGKSPVIDMQIFALGEKRPLGVHMTMPADRNRVHQLWQAFKSGNSTLAGMAHVPAGALAAHRNPGPSGVLTSVISPTWSLERIV